MNSSTGVFPRPIGGSTAGRGVLAGAFTLLTTLEQAGEAGLTALAAGSGLPKATAYRLLDQLMLLGAVERSNTGYRMGPRLFQLGHCWQPHPGLVGAGAGPVLDFARATNATVGVCVLRLGQPMAVCIAPGELDSVVPARPGQIMSPGTAAGKVLLATTANPPILPGTPRSWAGEAALIRDRGVAFDREELIEGVCCAAVPLHSSDGTVIAALFAMLRPTPRLASVAEGLRRVGYAIVANLEREPATVAN